MYTISIDINCYKVEMILSNWFSLFELAVGGFVIFNMLRSLLLYYYYYYYYFTTRIGVDCLEIYKVNRLGKTVVAVAAAAVA